MQTSQNKPMVQAPGNCLEKQYPNSTEVH